MKRFARPHVPEEELHAYADNQVSGGQRAEIAEHLMECLICRAQYAEVRDLRIRASEILSIAVPKIPAALQATGPAAAMSPRGTTTTRRRALIAAGLIVTVAGSWAVQPQSTRTAARASLAKVFVAPTLLASATPGVRTDAPSGVPLISTVAPAAQWRAMSWESALDATGSLPVLAGLPVSAVRIERTPAQASTVIIRQSLDDGHTAWIVVGSSAAARSALEILQRLGFTASQAADAIGASRVMVASRLPADRAAALAATIEWQRPTP